MVDAYVHLPICILTTWEPAKKIKLCFPAAGKLCCSAFCYENLLSTLLNLCADTIFKCFSWLEEVSTLLWRGWKKIKVSRGGICILIGFCCPAINIKYLFCSQVGEKSMLKHLSAILATGLMQKKMMTKVMRPSCVSSQHLRAMKNDGNNNFWHNYWGSWFCPILHQRCFSAWSFPMVHY